jgi:hypothetical protein
MACQWRETFRMIPDVCWWLFKERPLEGRLADLRRTDLDSVEGHCHVDLEYLTRVLVSLRKYCLIGLGDSRGKSEKE